MKSSKFQVSKQHINNQDISKICQSNINITKYQYSLLEQQIKKVRYPMSPISKAQKLQIKINTFTNQNVQKGLRDKLAKLNSYRQVRGDGNCFFRALAFAFISDLSYPSFDTCFSFIKQVKLTCCSQESIPKDFQKFYDNKFLKYMLEKYWQKIYSNCLKQCDSMDKKALVKLFGENPFLDFIVILYFRSVCLKSLHKNKDELKSFITGSEEMSIRTYSQETQGISVNLCSKIFEINIYVIEVRKEQVHCYDYEANSDKKDIGQIHLIFNQNHYDIIQFNANIEQEQFGFQKKQTFYSEVNHLFIQGTCLQCGQLGKVNEVSCLCYSCNEASLRNLNNFTQDGLMAGECNDCGKMREDISIELGLCKRCIEVIEDAQKRTEQRKKMKRMKECVYCGDYTNSQQIDKETGFCNSCIRDQQYEIKRIEKKQKVNAFKQQQNQQNKSEPKSLNVGEKNHQEQVKFKQEVSQRNKCCKKCNVSTESEDEICKKCSKLE